MRQREFVVSVRLNKDEAEAVQTAAERHGLSAGQYLRTRGLIEAAPALPLPIVRRRAHANAGELAEIAAHLGRIGGEAHEIARSMPTDQKTFDQALSAIRQELGTMRDLLASVLGVRGNP